MRLDEPSRYECIGKVKYQGYGTHGASKFKDGGLHLYIENGQWKLEVLYNVKREPAITFRVRVSPIHSTLLEMSEVSSALYSAPLAK